MQTTIKNYLSDYNPWKILGLTVIFANFVLIFDSSLVLIISLTLIFFVLIIKSVENFSASYFSYISTTNNYFSSQIDKTIVVLERLKNTLNSFQTVFPLLNSKLFFWIPNISFYNCLFLPTQKNFSLSFLPAYLRLTKKKLNFKAFNYSSKPLKASLIKKYL